MYLFIIYTFLGLHFGEPDILTPLGLDLGYPFEKVMNPFSLLCIPLPKALRIIARENDKTKVCSTYVEKMDLNVENPKLSKGKVHFNDVRRSIRHNPDLPL